MVPGSSWRESRVILAAFVKAGNWVTDAIPSDCDTVPTRSVNVTCFLCELKNSRFSPLDYELWLQ